MRISLSQISSSVGDFEGNYQKILAALEVAAQNNSTMAIFPELSLCGYLHRDIVEREDFNAQVERYLKRVAQNAPDNIYAIIGAPIRDSARRDCLHNAAVVIHNGDILHRQAKTALPNYDIFDERRYYCPAIRWGTFIVQGQVCGIAICEDVWQAEEYSADQLLEHGFGRCALPLHKLDLLIVCSASPYDPEKLQRRISLIKKCCSAFNFDAVYVNAVGAEDGILFDGQSFAIERSGALVQLSPMYQESDDTTLLPPPTTPDRSRKLPAFAMDRDLETEHYASLVFGVREYARKNGFDRAVLGVSGGIDSAVTAVIASDALGPKNVHALVMPSPYNAPSSVTDATELIDTLTLPSTTLPITEIFSAYRALLKEPLYDGRDADVTEQNIQARIRGMLIMAYANTTHTLPLTTGNKSELAVGYCTQYGDMAGGLTVIGDLYKGEVYQLARYINRDGEIIPTSIIEKPPSAELKPNQVDQDSLPPYDILDQVLRWYLEERASLAQIIDRGIAEEVARSIIRMHHRSEHKRTQAAPVIRVSKKAFGVGRRMLISRTPFELE